MTSLLVSIIVSACLGALVGLIRQWRDQAAPEGNVDFGGVRTYSLWAMLGCIGAFLVQWLFDHQAPDVPARYPRLSTALTGGACVSLAICLDQWQRQMIAHADAPCVEVHAGAFREGIKDR